MNFCERKPKWKERSLPNWFVKFFIHIYYDFLIVKLNAYDQSLCALKLVQTYFQSCKQRIQSGPFWNLWGEIVTVISQDLTLEPLFSNRYLCGLVSIRENYYFINHADDIRSYAIGYNAEVISVLNLITEKVFFRIF